MTYLFCLIHNHPSIYIKYRPINTSNEVLRNVRYRRVLPEPLPHKTIPKEEINNGNSRILSLKRVTNFYTQLAHTSFQQAVVVSQSTQKMVTLHFSQIPISLVSDLRLIIYEHI